MKNHILFVVAIGLLLLAGCSTQQDPQAVLDAHVEALNEGDIDTAMSLVADDAVFDTAFGDYSGREEIREQLLAVIDATARTDLSDIEVNGDVVTATMTSVRANGVSNTLECETVVQDGKITSFKLFFPCNPALEDCE